MTEIAMTDILQLPRELNIYRVAELCESWRTVVKSLGAGVDGATASAPGAIFSVDGAQVDDVDGAGIQLLLSLSRTLAAQQRELRLVNVSEALRHACEALGVDLRLTGAQAAEKSS